MRLKSLVISISLIGSLVVPPLGTAAIPPSWFMVKKTIEKRSNFTGAQITSVFSEFNNGSALPLRFKEIFTIDPKLGIVQGKITDDVGTDLYIYEKPISSFKWNLAHQAFFEKDYESFLKWLSAQKIPFKTPRELGMLRNEELRSASENTSLKRINGTVAWVVGNPSEKTSPQIWFLKDAFVPVFLRVKSLSYTFSQYRYFKEVPYPSEILVDAENEPSIRATLVQYSVGVAPNLTRQSGPSGFTARGLELHAQEKRLIEMYLARLR